MGAGQSSPGSETVIVHPEMVMEASPPPRAQTGEAVKPAESSARSEPAQLPVYHRPAKLEAGTYGEWKRTLEFFVSTVSKRSGGGGADHALAMDVFQEQFEQRTRTIVEAHAVFPELIQPELEAAEKKVIDDFEGFVAQIVQGFLEVRESAGVEKINPK